MDKNTLSNYGWILVSVMLMGVLMTFATPYGKYAMNNVNQCSESISSVRPL